VTRPDDAPDRTRHDSPRPVLLGPNQPIRRPYHGGAGIARLRGLEHVRDDVPEDFIGSTTEVASWVARQDVDGMLASLNRIAIRPGDSLLVPGGVPHAIGAGITLVELQEPTDYSILLEWTGYPIGPDDGHLGLGFDTALTALDRSGWDTDRLTTLSAPRASPAGISRLFPPDADPFFRAEQVVAPVAFPAGYSLLVVLAGQGELRCDLDTLPLRRGSTVLVPYAAGDIELTGTLHAVRCQPPDPS